jgi:hypothetical protein
MKSLCFLIAVGFSCIFSTVLLTGQDTIYLKNPSFEDVPRKGSPYSPPIEGWKDCAAYMFANESPPDIHPVPNTAWGVTKKAKDGKRYLGLVARYSNTFETLSQLLEHPLDSGKCYALSVYLSLSEKYDSPTHRSINGSTESFSNPVELFIWGGEGNCVTDQELAHSGAISHTDWKYYRLLFSPNKNYTHITIEAFYTKGSLETYNGHVLVDGFSPIIEVDCN